MTDFSLPDIIVLVNGILAALLVIFCLIYCFFRQRHRCIIHQHADNLRQAQNASTVWSNNTPMDHPDIPPAYHTVLENEDAYIRQWSKTPPPDYNEVVKLHQADMYG